MNSNEPIELFKDEKIGYISFPQLQQYGVKNAFSLLKWNFRNQEGMESAYRDFLSAIGMEYNQLIKPLQKHTNHVIVVNKKEKEDAPDIHLAYLEGVDGLITNQKNLILATTSADCLAIVLWDPKQKVLANIHSGWRGTFQKIVQQTIQKMVQNFECNPRDMVAFFMPAIRQCHFEVEEDVMLECQKIFKDTNCIETIIQKGRVLDGVQKYNIDNILINQLLLEETGVLPEHIYDSGICSVCHKEEIHSRRAEGDGFGLATTVVMIQ